MQINQLVENENGSVQFSGELSAQECEIVLALGLNMLYAQGLLSQMAPEINVDTHEPPEEIQ